MKIGPTITKKFVVMWGLPLAMFFALLFLFFIESKHINERADFYDVKSGLLIKTDGGTGCQYFAGSFGVFSPRYDETGKQICIKN